MLKIPRNKGYYRSYKNIIRRQEERAKSRIKKKLSEYNFNEYVRHYFQMKLGIPYDKKKGKRNM